MTMIGNRKKEHADMANPGVAEAPTREAMTMAPRGPATVQVDRTRTAKIAAPEAPTTTRKARARPVALELRRRAVKVKPVTAANLAAGMMEGLPATEETRIKTGPA